MKNLKQQTDLNAEEICGFLDNGTDSPYPRCLLANELGVIAHTQENKTAQKKLCELLNMEDECEKMKYVAFCWLCTIPKTAETTTALENFTKNQKNAEIIDVAAERDIHFN